MMLSASRKGPAFKPQLRVCYLCGQQFGSASIGIHIPQCYTKKVSQWEIADPATRGRRPKHPDTVNWKGEGMSTDKLNDEQFHEFTSNLVPCQRCGRRFLPDRLVVHLRSCKGDNERGTSKNEGRGGGGGGAGGRFAGTIGASQSSMQRGLQSARSLQSSRKRSSSPSSLGPGYKPVLPICYLCGQQFGSTSIVIHVPQCYAKKLAQWEVADVHTRGKPPRHPDTVNWKNEGTNIEDHNNEQFTEFVNNLEPCPNCGRKFLADRLIVHLRSCKPGATSKPVQEISSSRSSEPRGSSVRPGTEGGGFRPLNREKRGVGATKDDTKDKDDVTKDMRSINPKIKRLPKDGKICWDGIVCTRCGVVEYDASAKFCRDCGTSLVSKNLPDPCAQCGEQIPEGSRFCGTCGVPVNGAAATERNEGVENANVPTIRVVACPACKAVCDADGNFCDNCGAALGNVEPSSTPAMNKEVMYCKNCSEFVSELSAKFCEDCGGVLEKVSVNTLNAKPHEKPSTLPFGSAYFDTPTKETVPVPPVGGGGGGVSLAGEKSLPHLRIREDKNHTGKYSANGAQDAQRRGSRGSTRREPSTLLSPSKKIAINDKPEVFDVGDDDDMHVVQRVECSNCGRKFAPDVLEKHEGVCVKQKKRKAFNMRAVRLSGTDAENVERSNSPARAVAESSKRDWRAESEGFRRTLREARLVDKVLKSGGNVRNLPPPTYSENSHYTPCPHCGRKFAPDVAERHIPRCATTINKPKPPPRRR